MATHDFQLANVGKNFFPTNTLHFFVDFFALFASPVKYTALFPNFAAASAFIIYAHYRFEITDMEVAQTVCRQQ